MGIQNHYALLWYQSHRGFNAIFFFFSNIPPSPTSFLLLSMASSSVSTCPTQPSQPKPITPITVLNHRIIIRLSNDNFLLWKAQLTPFLRGQNLFGYVDGSIPPPPRFYHTTSIDSSEQQMLPNPAFDLWL